MSLDDLFEGIGKAASPLKPALDFALPQYEAGGQGFDVGTLLSSFGDGVGDMIEEGPAGLLNAGRAALSGQGSARERLLLGGLAVGGAALSARAAHQHYRASRKMMPARASTGYEDLQRLGDNPRFMTQTPEAEALAVARPGISPRQIQVMAPQDYDGVVRGFARWDHDDLAKNGSGAAIFDRYARQIPEGAEGAQVDFARFDHAVEKGLFRYEDNARVRELWGRVTNDPTSLADSPEDLDEILGVVRAFGDATGATADDLSVGIAGRIERVDAVDGDVRIYVTHPSGWDDGRIIDPTVREARLSQLNYRSLSGRGLENLERLFDLADDDIKRVAAGGPSLFKKPLELGPEWYPTALRDVTKTFDIAGDEDAISRAVATVSFLSEAEDWSTNIVKARDTLRLAGDVSDVDFQNYLRNNVTLVANDPKTRYVYSGQNAAAHEARLVEVWGRVKGAGFKVDKTTMRKVLRLWGGVETVDDVFRSTVARKQKNFYLNIRYPELEHPVTIDRHAFDAFLGMDSGTQDRPIDLSLRDGDQVYDVVADTYRALAARKGLLPHQLQAVIWEGWRQLKAESPRNGWKNNDPFMLPSPDGSPNQVFEALNGRGHLPASLHADGDPTVPIEVLQAKTVGDLTSIGNPDGSVVHAGAIDDRIATTNRHLYPAIEGTDRVARWIPATPRPLNDAEVYRRAVLSDPLASAETYLEIDLATRGGHPLFRAGDTVTFELDDGAKIRAPQGAGRMGEIGRAAVERPELNFERLGPEDLDPDAFIDPERSPLATHAWAAISPMLDEAQTSRLGINGYDLSTAQKQLNAELTKRGFKPIIQKGMYGGAEEPSFMVFGITPAEALELGEKFGQDSVITNKGLLYHRSAPNSPETAGLLEPTGGVSFDDGDMEFGYSELVIGGKTVRWTATDWADTTDYDLQKLHRTSTNVRKVELPVNAGHDAVKVAEELEARGAKNVSVYTTRPNAEGWERAYETAASDGRQLIVTRTKTGQPHSAHGGHVLTRSTGGLPDAVSSGSTEVRPLGDGRQAVGDSLVIDGRFPAGNAEFNGSFEVRLNGEKPTSWGYRSGTLTPIFDEVEEASGRFDAIIKGKKITPADETDVTGALRAQRALKDAGWPDELELSTSSGRFKFTDEKRFSPDPAVITTVGGLQVPHLRTDRPSAYPDWVRDFGFELDPGYRVGNEVHELTPELVGALRGVTEQFMGAHASAARRWRLPKVSVSVHDDDSVLAWLEWNPGGGIGLNKKWWSDPELFDEVLTLDRVNRHLSPRLPRGPETILAHEYGHVLHGALLAGEGWKVSSPIDKDIRALVKTHGSGSWKRIASDQISRTAADDVSELVAESYSEVLMSEHPSRLALNVYDLVVDRLDSQLSFRKAVNW